MADTILPAAFDIASNIENAAVDVRTALSLINSVVMEMNCGDKDEVMEAQGKLLYLLRGLPESVREIQLEVKRLFDECRVLPGEAG